MMETLLAILATVSMLSAAVMAADSMEVEF